MIIDIKNSSGFVEWLETCGPADRFTVEYLLKMLQELGLTQKPKVGD